LWTTARRRKNPKDHDILGDLANEALRGEFADKEFRGFLVASDFTERNGAWPKSVWLFDTPTGGLVGIQLTGYCILDYPAGMVT
jgi:uncharacterized protein YozE (UPF0346 family)